MLPTPKWTELNEKTRSEVGYHATTYKDPSVCEHHYVILGQRWTSCLIPGLDLMFQARSGVARCLLCACIHFWYYIAPRADERLWSLIPMDSLVLDNLPRTTTKKPLIRPNVSISVKHLDIPFPGMLSIDHHPVVFESRFRMPCQPMSLPEPVVSKSKPIEEAAFAPIDSKSHLTQTVIIITPSEEQDYYSVLLNQKRLDGQPMFKCIPVPLGPSKQPTSTLPSWTPWKCFF